MKLLSILGKGIQAMVNETMIPESFKICQTFEEYVRQFVFINGYYDLLERARHYNGSSKRFGESSSKPDFKFRDRRTNREFYVEAKFRAGLHNGTIVWSNENEMRRYHAYNVELPVFIILGMGEEPAFPEFLALMPLTSAKHMELSHSFAERFKIKLDEPVPSTTLWKTSSESLGHS